MTAQSTCPIRRKEFVEVVLALFPPLASVFNLSNYSRWIGGLERICFACGGSSPVSPGIHDAANARRLSDTD